MDELLVAEDEQLIPVNPTQVHQVLLTVDAAVREMVLRKGPQVVVVVVADTEDDVFQNRAAAVAVVDIEDVMFVDVAVAVGGVLVVVVVAVVAPTVKVEVFHHRRVLLVAIVVVRQLA